MANATSSSESPAPTLSPSSLRIEGFSLFAAFALLYGATASSSFLGGDSGLFAAITAGGGYAHPPGYPLYSAYLRALAWLPVLSPAHAASVSTALLGAGAVAVLYLAARRWNLSRSASLFGAVAFGFAPYVWVYHTQPEVFALNHLLSAGILWAVAPGAPVRGSRRAILLGLFAGLGLSHHHPVVLMAPIGLWGVHLAVEESARGRLATLAAGAGALIVGLLPYSYLLAVEYWDLGWHWRDPDSLGDLLHLFLRRDYGTFQLNPGEAPAGAATQGLYWARSTLVDLFVVAPIAAVAGLVGGIRAAFGDQMEGPGGLTPLAAAALLLAIVATGPFFVALLPRHPEGLNRLFLRRFHLMSQLHVAFAAAFGAQYALDRWLRPRLMLATVAALVAAGGLIGASELDVRHRPAVENYVRDTFGPVEREAVVVGTGDHNFFGALYLREGIGERGDVGYIDAEMLAHRWYHRRVVERLGISYPYRGNDVDTDALFEAIHETGRPLYLTHTFHPTVLEGWPSEPFGTLIRVRSKHNRPRNPVELFRTNRRLYRSFEISTFPEAPADSWARFVLEDYASTWRSLAAALRRVGRPELAAEAEGYANRFAPWRRPR